MDIKEIRRVSTNYRNAIEAIAPQMGYPFSSFPAGACGDTSYLLGTYLIEKNLGTFDYMSGVWHCGQGDWAHHSWIQKDGFIVDLTADQFPDVQEKVIAEKESTWHQSLSRMETDHNADFHVYEHDKNTFARYRKWYFLINEQLSRA